MTLGLTLGGFMLAIWADARLSERRPATPSAGLVHAAVSLMTLFGSVGLLMLLNGHLPQTAFVFVVLAVFLPALVYSMLAGVWLLRTLADLSRFAGR